MDRKLGASRSRTVSRVVVVGVLLGAIGGSLWVKSAAERAWNAETVLTQVTAEVRLQDGLEWRAIAGRADDSLPGELAASGVRATRLLESAVSLGLDQTTCDRLVGLERSYLLAVDRELALLDAGRQDAAEAWDEEHVDPAAAHLLEELDATTEQLRRQGVEGSRWADLGLVLGAFIALSAMALLQRTLVKDRAQHEQRLRSEARYRALVDRSRDLVVVCDKSGHLEYLSPAAERALSGSDLPPMREARDRQAVALADLVVPDDAPGLAVLLADAAREGDAGPIDLRFPGKGGVAVYRFSARDLTADPAVAGLVLTGHDVTHDRELEQEREDFVSTVSHELRTPLTSIRAHVEMLEDEAHGPVPDHLRGPLAVLGRNADRLFRLVEELLFLSGLAARPPAVGHRRFDLTEVVTRVVADSRPLTGAERVELVVPATPVEVVGEEADLERVVGNLLGNALKFSPETSRVRIELEQSGEHALMRVVDSGIGIPQDEQDRVFSRFFRSSLSKQQAIQGTGLGLVICRAIVESHGGTIELRSTAGRGTTVSVLLPRRAGEQVDSQVLAPH